MNTMDKIRALDPVTAEEVQQATRNREGAWQGLLARTTQEEADAPVKLRPRRPVVRRLVPALVAASLIGGIAVTAYERSDDNRTEALSPALSFATENDTLKITVIDLYADTERFNRELKDHGINFELKLQPATPSVVGKEAAAAFSDGSNVRLVTVGETPVGCTIGGAAPCNITISVNTAFKGEGVLEIGRPLRPGEDPLYSGTLTDPGEPLEGAKFGVLRVGAAKEMLRQRGMHVSEYSAEFPDLGSSELRDDVPNEWFVLSGVWLGADKVRLDVSERAYR
ncbi:hypothetical protein [Kribbella sp. NPDC051770]|uniref:hypothetical protein n=1 Tax=Kribbella sp. NPDC051770 TaxID=3155413 RepID=UPI00341E765A